MKKFKKLKIELSAEEYTQLDVAKLLNRSECYAKERFRGERSFTLKDVYILCSELEIPFDKITEYWPIEEVMQCQK